MRIFKRQDSKPLVGKSEVIEVNGTHATEDGDTVMISTGSGWVVHLSRDDLEVIVPVAREIGVQ